MKLIHRDERGTVWTLEDGTHSIIVCSEHARTLRGIHWQEAPAERAKLVTVLAGTVRFVTVNLNDGTYVLRDMKSGGCLHVTKDQACGYLTLSADAVIHYDMNQPQSRKHERGIRWDDPRLKIDWGAVPALVNERDRSWPDFEPRGNA